MNKITLKDELQSLELDVKKTILKRLKEELKNVKDGKRRSFYTSEYLVHSNVEYVMLLNKHFENTYHKEKDKAWKFLNEVKNEQKFNIYHKKPKMQDWEGYTKLAFPELNEEVWELELEEKVKIW